MTTRSKEQHAGTRAVDDDADQTAAGLPSLPDLRSISAYGYRLELFDEGGTMIGSMSATGGDPQHKVLREIYELAEGTYDVPEGKEGDLEVGINKALDYLKRS